MRRSGERKEKGRIVSRASKDRGNEEGAGEGNIAFIVIAAFMRLSTAIGGALRSHEVPA